jgi:choline dehydrogenase-like flavoprotein
MISTTAGESSAYDAIIIGSGAGGCAAAYKLVSAGLRVALLEKGHALPRDASTLDFDKVVHQGAFKSRERWRDGRGAEFAPEEHFNVGGKTKWYGAALLRYGRHEFDGDRAHQCLPWPIGYDTLAPYYDEAEQLLDVRTFEPEPDLANIIGRVQRTARGWRAEPLQLGLHRDIAQHRLEAMRFDGFASVANLKSDGETAFLSRLGNRANLSLLPGACVEELIGDDVDPMRIRGVQLRDGRRLFANTVLLAAGALHSPRLLQRYLAKLDAARRPPAANAVGRNLKLHLLTAVVAISSSPKTDLIRKTTLLLNDALPHSSVQPLGFDGQLIGTLIPRIVPRGFAREVGARAYGFFLQTEDGSHAENRVLDAGRRRDDLPVLDYDAQRCAPALREHHRLVAQFRLVLARAGLLALSERIGLAGTAHACGTLVAGEDPATSVVDPHGKVHGVESLYVVDGSVLPRSARVNPSLTIYAWSLRVAERLARSLASSTSGIPASEVAT